jgi:hypothetical protein
MSKRAITHLSSDPVLSGLIEKIGHIRLRPPAVFRHFNRLPKPLSTSN